MVTQAFGISSLVLAIVSIFIPVYGVFISGLSGVFAWCSVGRAVIFGLAAVIINLCNVIFLSPVFLSLSTINSVNQLSNQDKEFKYWIIVLIVQLIAVFIFLFNAVLLNYIGRKRFKSALSEESPTAEDNDVQNSYDAEFAHIATAETTSHLAPSPLTKVLIKKVYGNRKGERTFWINRFNNVSTDNSNISKRRKDYNPVYILGIVFLLCGISAIAAYHIFFNKESYVPLNRVYETSRVPPVQKPHPNRSTQPSNEGRYYPGTQAKLTSSNDNSPIERIYSYVDSEGKTQYTNSTPPDGSTNVKLHPELTKIEMITPVEISGSEIYVPVIMMHRGNQFSTSLLFDPTSPHTILPGRNADFLKADYLHAEKYQISKEDQIVQEVRKLEVFKIGPHEYHDFLVVTQSGKGAVKRGILGADILTRYPYNLDRERKVIVWF